LLAPPAAMMMMPVLLVVIDEIISKKTDSPQAAMTAGQDSVAGPESGKTEAG
jgi:hypothetical protein